MAYQYRGPKHQGKAQLEQHFQRLKQRAEAAERERLEAAEAARQAGREARASRRVETAAIRDLNLEKDYWRLEVRRLSAKEPEPPAPVADWTLEEDLKYHDSLIRRCKCGAWMYNAPLCKYHERQEESMTA